MIRSFEVLTVYLGHETAVVTHLVQKGEEVGIIQPTLPGKTAMTGNIHVIDVDISDAIPHDGDIVLQREACLECLLEIQIEAQFGYRIPKVSEILRETAQIVSYVFLEDTYPKLRPVVAKSLVDLQLMGQGFPTLGRAVAGAVEDQR